MTAALAPSLTIVLQVITALILGWAIGYERYFHGRASGTQVYCLVCMASCALTVAMGYPTLWYGGHSGATEVNPTSVIGSILTGIGFLGAGLIVKGGTSIRGLTTAASIWSTAAVGILVGLSFYGAAIGLAALFIACMGVLPRLESLLPGHAALTVTLRYREGYILQEDVIHDFLAKRQLAALPGSVSVGYDGHRFDLQLIIVSVASSQTQSLSRVSIELPQIPHLESFTIAQTNRG